MKKRLIILLTAALMLLPVFCVSAEEDLVNVARYQLATASTEAEGHEADMANDDINDNADHTYWKNADGDTSPYWQTDLGVPYKLTKIELEARKEAGENERKNLRILASETESFKESVELYAVEEDYGDMLTIDITKKARYRYIRVEKTDASAFSIGEIRVLVKKGDILQGMDVINMTDQIPATDEAGRYVISEDVLGTRYEKAVRLLSALNIMRGYPDGDFLPEEAITRAEFATVAMRLMGEMMTLSSRSFVDVTPDHWAYQQIEAAAKKQIVNGTEAGIFEPESPILTPQVIKMLVCVLGYGEAAQLYGKYPDGYMEMASRLGLFEDIELLHGDSITRGEIALLCYNALETDIMTPGLAYSVEVHTSRKGENVLTEYLGLAKGKGIVTATGNTSLTSVSSKKDETYLEIDGVGFESDIPQLSSYLGYSVEYYYENDENEEIKKVVALIVSGKNEAVTIDASELIKVEGNTLYYNIEDEEQLSLSPEMDLIYNGAALSVYDKTTDLVPSAGSVTLIDNNGDGEIDVYIVNKIENYIVNWVNTSKSQVYSKNISGALVLDEMESDVKIVNKSNGAEMSLSEIVEWNVLSVMESRNDEGKRQYYVIVSTELIRGTYSGRGNNYITIDGNEYKTAASFDKNSLELGAKGIFYLDAENKIAAFNGEEEPDEKYGFLRAAGSDNVDLSERLSLRVFTDEGIFVTLYGTEEIIIDGAPYTDPAVAERYLATTGMNGTEAQAIRYTINGKGEVKAIETTNGALTKDYDAEAGTPAPKTSDRGYYYTSAGTFDALFSVDEKTVMIELPSGDLSTEKDYSLLSSAGVRAGRYYYVQAFDTGEERLAKLIIFTGGASGGAADSTTFFLAESVLRSINEDGEEAYEVTGLYSGEKQSFFIDADLNVDINDFKAGNVLTLAFTGDVITDYEIKFFRGAKPDGAPSASVSEETPQYGANVQGLMGTLWLGYGTVETKKNGIVRLSFENVGVANPGSSTEFVNYDELVMNLANVRIYSFDNQKDKVHVASAGEVLDKATVGDSEASKVLVRADSGNFIEMIILD